MKESPEEANGGLVATVAAATVIAILAGLGFVNVQSAPADLMAVELLYGRVAFFLGRHFDEAKAA